VIREKVHVKSQSEKRKAKCSARSYMITEI